MAFTLPDFNLTMDVWSTTDAASGPPDFTNVPCQKYINSRYWTEMTPPWAPGYSTDFHPAIHLRTPFAPPFDLTVPNLYASAIMFECPSGSGSYYLLRHAEIMHEGFPNQYVTFGCVQCHDDATWLEPNIP